MDGNHMLIIAEKKKQKELGAPMTYGTTVLALRCLCVYLFYGIKN